MDGSARRQRAQDDAPRSDGSRITVLLADDSLTQLRMVERLLEAEGFRVICAKDGVEGVNRAYTDAPDVIVSDIVMPEVNGYQLCRLIKSDWFTAHIPVILLTSLGQGQDRFWGGECGADAYLTKEEELHRLPSEVRRLYAQRPVGQSPLTDPVLVTASELGSAAVKSRINYLLDRFLFQSTVANRIREITRYLHDERLMVERFFDLLARLEDHEVAVLGFPTGDEMHVHIHAARATSRDLVRRVRAEALQALCVTDGEQRLHLSVYGSQNVSSSLVPNGEFHSVSLPLPLAPDKNGVLAIARFSHHPFDAENENTFQIVANELVMVVGYYVKVLENEKLQSDFTSMIVHDIRTPMTGVQGYAEILSDGLAGPLNEQQREMVDGVLRLSRRVVDLVSDVLDVSKIEAGRLDLSLSRYRLADPARAALASLRPIVARKSLRVEVVVDGDEPEVTADEQRVEQVFANLLSNAVKFTPDGGSIRIVFTATDEHWSVSVTDTGVGIPAEEMPLLFEKYRSASSRKSLTPARGTGLGLVIVKRIVEAHGGTITVTSAVGKGTTFAFRIPFLDASQTVDVVGL
jgi:signal transduction histidine kinase